MEAKIFELYIQPIMNEVYKINREYIHKLYIRVMIDDPVKLDIINIDKLEEKDKILKRLKENMIYIEYHNDDIWCDFKILDGYVNDSVIDMLFGSKQKFKSMIEELL